MKIAERAATLARIFNIREKFSVDDDILPQRISQPFNKGPTAGEKITNKELEQMKRIYYDIMGWNEMGIPTYGKIIELDIEWATKHLPSTIST
jgi:aldehyde:ferredoxin oxidoreductase